MTASTARKVRIHRSVTEEARRDAVMAEVAVLLRKYDEHTLRGYGRVALGALDGLAAAYRGEEA